MNEQVFETDVLCVGGGIAGLMAAIRAGELGAKVVIAEKGNTLYSGAGRAGNDHFRCYIPEFHGQDLEGFIKDCLRSQLSAVISNMKQDMLRIWMERSFEIVKLWDDWGIPMKYRGKWEFAGHSFPGHMLTHLKYSGQNQKKVLQREALKRGAKIINRTMICELLGSPDGVTGALGIDTREDKLIHIRAKSVILGTGCVTRMYPGVTPALMGNECHPFTLTGDGRAMAYRLGAELVNMEMVGRHVGIRYFVRSGQGTWIGVYRDPHGKPLGPFVSKPSRRYGDILPEVDKQLFTREFEAGRGPVYMDCTGISKQDLDYMKYWLFHEGNAVLLNYFEEEGIDPMKNPLEFMTYNITSQGRIFSNAKAETSVAGLYSAGDETTFGISGAAVFGWIAGESAIECSNKMCVAETEKEKVVINKKKTLIAALQGRKHGPDWKDANITLQQLMYDYAGLTRSETMLEAGLTHLRRLSEKIHNTMRAANRWELTRCLEVLNLYNLAELVFLSALERKESRNLHKRVDYAFSDPRLNDKFVIVKQVKGEPVFEFRDR